MSTPDAELQRRLKRASTKKRLLGLYFILFGAGLLLVIFAVSVARLALQTREPLFRGKPESYWIEHLSYRDKDQVKQWRAFGPDGVRVLVRALEKANRPGEDSIGGLIAVGGVCCLAV